MTIAQKFIIEGILVLLVLLMLWLIGRALRRRYVQVDPLFWIDAISLFDVTVRRATMPIVYWLIVSLQMAIAVALFVCMGAILLSGAVSLHK